MTGIMCAIAGSGGFAPLLASIPASVGSSSTGAVQNANCSVTVSGGSGTYSYAWSRVSGAADNVSTGIACSGGNPATFTANFASPGSRIAVWTCIVTDVGTGAAVSAGNVTVTLQREP